MKIKLVSSPGDKLRILPALLEDAIAPLSPVLQSEALVSFGCVVLAQYMMSEGVDPKIAAILHEPLTKLADMASTTAGLRPSHPDKPNDNDTGNFSRN
jgi:hypothetical protein